MFQKPNHRIGRTARFTLALLLVTLSGWLALPGTFRRLIEPRAQAAGFTVNSTGDGPASGSTSDGVCTTGNTVTINGVPVAECTLRAAIQEANALAGTDTINFNITSGCNAMTSVCTISPTSALPAINPTMTTDMVAIDGYTQPGTSVNTLAVGDNAVLLIELNGTSAPGAAFIVNSANNTFKGLVINRFVNASFNPGHAFRLLGAGNTIQGCYLGTNPAGDTASPNNGGISVEAGGNNIIGGTTTAARNVILGGNNIGALDITSGGGNTIQGNYIGTNAAGSAILGRPGIGIRTANNTIGGTVAGASNVMAANAGLNLLLQGSTATGNTIQGNYIGIKATGDATLGGTGTGITLSSAPNNTIGGTAAGAGNVISGNVGGGITAGDSDNLIIQGNLIGTNAAGTAAVPNGFTGITLNGGSNSTIGGTTPGARNIISGNGPGGNSHGIRFTLVTATAGNVIQGNYIGTDITGTVALGNGGSGIQIFAFAPPTASNALTVGGTTAAARNIISANANNGILLLSPKILVQGNFIGPDVNGSSLGNVGFGIDLQCADNNTVGGTGAAAGNVIAFNGMDGVRVASCSSGGVVTGVNNSIRGNSIFSNGKLGINLLGGTESASGVTANDSCDADTGANNLQNFPILSLSGATLSGTLNSTANTTFAIDFFSNSSPDPSGNGEGQTFLRSITVTTDGSCNASFNDVRFPTVIPAGRWITATATDPLGNTSEFSPAIQLTAPTATNGIVSGRILDDHGNPVAGAVIRMNGTQNRKTITAANGNYTFAEVETNGFYTVTPARVNYSFSPSNKSFSLVGNITEAAFTAIPDAAPAWNPLDTAEYFVRQHYLDFLGREPDESGFNFWSDQILSCGSDAACIERRTVNVSAAYFLSIEFQQTGGLVDGLYRASYGRRPLYAEFVPDTGVVARDVVVGRADWAQTLEANKQAFVAAWVERQDFRATYDGLGNAAFVDALIAHTNAGFNGDRTALVRGLDSGNLTRAGALRQVVENDGFVNAKRNEAFVMMQYFGYLRRDPDAAGYQFWLNKLNQFNGNFEQAEMVKAFITSAEYRQRFGQP